MASQCVIYTMCIKGHFRSAKCLNNSIHVNEVRSARSKERMGEGREGAREGEEAGIGPRVTDMVMVLYFQLPLHCPSERPITTVHRGEERKEGTGGDSTEGTGRQGATKSNKINNSSV